MNFRKISLAVATIAALAPALSNASPERAALDACARAFASSLAPPGGAAPAYSVAYRSNQYVGSVTEFFARVYTFELHANDKKSGLAIARASCTTDTHGAVIALTPIPMSAAQPALAAQL
jgi:hypothetical protein